jgi:hypothetical protein
VECDRELESGSFHLFIDRRDNGVRGRIDIEADQIAQFIEELRIFREVELPNPTWLEPGLGERMRVWWFQPAGRAASRAADIRRCFPYEIVMSGLITIIYFAIEEIVLLLSHQKSTPNRALLRGFPATHLPDFGLCWRSRTLAAILARFLCIQKFRSRQPGFEREVRPQLPPAIPTFGPP